MTDGWRDSADAWIASIGEHGDWGRRYVLDAPMLDRALARTPRTALDVGCGEGRFCRMLAAAGIVTTGLDPTAALLQRARELHPEGNYIEGRGENLGMFADGAFDLVVSYLSLIDIAAADIAIAEMARVLAPGGELLVANLSGFATAGEPETWRRTAPLGERRATFDRYLEIRAQQARWRGIEVTNWHRPISWYFAAFLANGLTLVEFLEPVPDPDSRPAEKAERYRRAPYYCVFRWKKPLAPCTR